MSLKDTIKGAREEVAASGNPFERKSNKGDDAQADMSRPGQGFSRRSAARGKPSRQAAAGVRVVSTNKKPQSDMSKQERKVERRRERDLEDRRYSVTQILLKENEEYTRLKKFWWVFLIAGVVFMGISLAMYSLVTKSGQSPENWMGVVAIVCMVLAYVVIIAGLLFDFLKIRPLRKEIEKRTNSMSDKRLKARLAENAKKEEEEKAARKASRKKRR